MKPKTETFCLLSIFSVLVFAAVVESAQFSAYDVLESYGFPEGLLPKIVDGYSLEADGRFVLNLDGSCYVDIPDAYPVKYSSKITGKISYDHLSDLQGISVKLLFVWWDISGISVSGGDLVFQVGPFSASYAISNFSENPECEGRFSELLPSQ